MGDTCLFQTRESELICSFPVGQSSQFGTTPFLVGTKTPLDEIRDVRTTQAHGNALPNDRLWMMTDALSQWFWKEHESGNKPWEDMGWLLKPSATNEEFALWIDDLRAAKRLRNDDVTLLAVTLQADVRESALGDAAT